MPDPTPDGPPVKLVPRDEQSADEVMHALAAAMRTALKVKATAVVVAVLNPGGEIDIWRGGDRNARLLLAAAADASAKADWMDTCDDADDEEE